MPEIPIFFVDAFSSTPFAGNPAAVCIVDSSHQLSTETMQQIASEVNLSETAFVEPQSGSLRWFTPVAEVDLCGHATLATADALRHSGLAQAGDTLKFETRSGCLIANLLGDGSIELDFPATPSKSVEPTPQMRNLFPDAVEFQQSRFDLLVQFSDEGQIRKYQPDFGGLGGLEYRGVMVTAQAAAGSGFDFVSRFFAPRVGVDEDPVTGSAHCCLAPYWADRLSKKELLAVQLSQRGGSIQLSLSGDRVKLRGQAVLMIKGFLFPDANS